MQNSFAKKLFAVGLAASTALWGLAPLAVHAASHAAGTNVSTSDGTVWMITSNGTRRAYTSAGAFLSYGFNSWSGVVAANSDDLALPVDSAGFIPPQDGSIICSDRAPDKGTCYLVTGGLKAGFTSAAVFTGRGFSFSHAQNGDASWMGSTSNINDTTSANRPGVLVNHNGTVYLMGPTGLLGIPDPATFNSWGYSYANVVPANAADNGMVQTGVMAARIPGQLSPTALANTCVSNCGTGVTPPAVTGLSVSLDPATPAAGSVAKTAKVVFTRFDLTAGNSPVTVNSLAATRLSLSSDSDVQNVYLYNEQTGLQLAVGSINSGRVTFSGTPLLTVPANSTVVLSVRADMGSTTNATTGDNIGYGVVSASDIQSFIGSSPVNVSGNFPVDGNLFTVAAVSNLGSLLVTSPATLSSTVNPGTLQTNVGYFSFAGSNQPLSITMLHFTMIGSVTNSNLQNINLFANATQIGSTMQLGSDNTVTFNLASSPLVIPSGQTVLLWLRADVQGGSNRNFQFTIQRTSDITVTDTTYNTGIVPSLATVGASAPIPLSNCTVGSSTNQPCNQISVNAGSATMSVDVNSPTGNIATGASGVPLSTFDFTAAGENVQVSAIALSTTLANISGGSDTDYLTNGKLVADATITNGVVTGGTQVGSSFNLNIKSASSGAIATSVSIPGYWVIPYGTTHTLTLVADTKANTATAAQLSNNGTGTIHGDITSVTAQGQSSLSSVTFGSATGRTLTMASGALTAALNTSLSNASASQPTGVGGQTNVRIGSFTLTAGSSEGSNITLVQITATSTAHTYIQNMKVYLNNNTASQIGTTVGVVANSSVNSFTPTTAIVIPAGGSISLDVYADLISGVGTATIGGMVSLTGATATGVVDSSSLTMSPPSVMGQTVYFASSGALATSVDAANPTASQLQELPMGLAGQTLAVFNFASSNLAEGVSIQKLQIDDTTGTANTQGDFNNFQLYIVGGTYTSPTAFGPVVPNETASTVTTDGILTFNMQTNPLVIPANNNYSVYLKANVSAYPNAGSGDTHTFKVLTAANITALGSVSGSSITSGGTFPVAGNQGVVYRSSLTIALPSGNSSPYTSTPSGLSSASATQNVAVFTLTNYQNLANQQATFIPTLVQTGTSNGIATTVSFTLSSTIAQSNVGAGTARTFKLFKATDLTNAILAATITPSGTNSVWSGTLTFGYGLGTAASGAASAVFVPASSTTWVGFNASTTAVSITPQTINAGQTMEYVAQFDTSDAASQKSFTLSLQSQTTGNLWYDGSKDVTNFLTLPITFGTLTY